MRSPLRTNFAAVAAFAVFSALARAQSSDERPANEELFTTVAGLDAALFGAYNHRQLDKLGSMVAENLEFYHDQAGLSVGRTVFLEAIRSNACGGVHRELIEGSLEVYPLKGFGAVEIGLHRFTHADDPGAGGQARFVAVWRQEDGVWQVTRAISFDHRALG